jgi:uncharacterized protein (TIGR03435 family)
MAISIRAKRMFLRTLSAAALLSGCLEAYAQVPVNNTLQFDVASIRQAKPELVQGLIKPSDSGDGYTVQGASLLLMISLMYEIPPEQIQNAPDWVKADPYDVASKTEAQCSLDDLHAMFKNMLADRFALKFHWETKPGNAYVLAVDKSGPKMTPNDQPQNYQLTVTGNARAGTSEFHRESMEHFSWWLGRTLQRDGRPVVDQTGLKGYYDFKLAFLHPGISVEPGRELPPELQGLPSLPDALHDQLGLKLTAQKAPVQYMVIDHVDRPTAN